MTEVIMPKMGDGMEEGTLLEWLKHEGDKVKSGEIIGTIQTDKATLELEAPGSGTLAGFLINGGETVPVGKPIAALLTEGEKLPANWTGGSGAAAPTVTAPKPVAETPATPETQVASVASSANGGRVKASPLARKIAASKGIDLASLAGTGPGGRIVEKDVESATGRVLAPASQSVAGAQDRIVALNRLRQITAQRTAQSKAQAPHFYVTVETDVEKIMELRQMFEDEASGKVSINDFVVKACALTLQDMPEVNAAFQGDHLLIHGGVHVGIAVALPDGLTVPVIKNASQLSLRQISARAKELATKARENKLGMDELAGSTFSISNMGMLDVDNFLAIINLPNSAILAISSVRKRVVVGEGDEIEIRQRMNITCSFDHRVVDGALGARFINAVRAYLENPSRLLA